MPSESALAKFLKENAIALTVWLMTAGVWAGSMIVTVRWIDARLSRLEEMRPEQTKWQVDAHAIAIGSMQADDRITQEKINAIQNQMGVMNTKLDTLIELLKQQQNIHH